MTVRATALQWFLLVFMVAGFAFLGGASIGERRGLEGKLSRLEIRIGRLSDEHDAVLQADDDIMDSIEAVGAAKERVRRHAQYLEQQQQELKRMTR